MSRHLFGWSYPPGAANDPPCTVCGRFEEQCICPECPTCGMIGSIECYERHGMIRSAEQVAALAEAEAQWRNE